MISAKMKWKVKGIVKIGSFFEQSRQKFLFETPDPGMAQEISDNWEKFQVRNM